MSDRDFSICTNVFFSNCIIPSNLYVKIIAWNQILWQQGGKLLGFQGLHLQLNALDYFVIEPPAFCIHIFNRFIFSLASGFHNLEELNKSRFDYCENSSQFFFLFQRVNRYQQFNKCKLREESDLVW